MTTTGGITITDPNVDKHMGGCMSAFFNIFDRSRLLTAKRLPPPSDGDTLSCSGSPALSREFEKLHSPLPEKETEAVPLQVNETVKSPWKFSREAPRLSLDSRAVTDRKGGLRPREIRINTVVANSGKAIDDEEVDRDNQRRSPSVIARLMGLDQLPSSVGSDKRSELRRSASESRSTDYYRFVETSSFFSPVRNYTNEGVGDTKLDHSIVNRQSNKDGTKRIINNSNKTSNQRRTMIEKRSYYDTTDFFPPEIPPKQQHQAVSIYGEIERRLRMKGMDEPSKDIDTLKHILEALQLKGLLHSSSTSGATTIDAKLQHTVAYNRRFYSEEESPIVLLKPGNRQRNNCHVSAGEPVLSQRRERPARISTPSPGRGDNRSSGSVLRRKNGPLCLETQRNGNKTTAVRRSISPVQSPREMRLSEQTFNRSPGRRELTAEIYKDERVLSGPTFAEDETSTVSASSFTTSSYTDNERWRLEDYKDGRSLLERCGKLLHNIAEITANSNSNTAESQQPSPVSVLDSSFYKDDESSPSPVKKRTIDFKDQAVIELENELWSPTLAAQLLKRDSAIDSSESSELNYVSEVIRASNYLPDDDDLFFLLERQSSARGIGRDKTKASILQRKLIFDTVTEILGRNRQLPPWKVASWSEMRPVLDQIWSEFQKIREQYPSEDLLGVICGVLKKDLSRDSINGWMDSPVEMSEAVLDIERLIFKDLIGETIQDLGRVQAPRRKLVF
ncbi:protein LONGIFOLIA 2-like [Silene latifolia]|uniref:protein LONGIFOLIA 2-like n=1 Tax=Silene latifolia TaxID=37657 RepID=UPI003D776FF0